ncbi:MAG: hypothetical protein ABR976_10440 [Terracidiphilus sp.]|jgi:cytochrome c553
MKRFILVALMFLGTAGISVAQITSASNDVLGAHLNYGRGCPACHAPHSGASGNGNARSANPNAGGALLWGQDVSGLYGKTITTGGGGYVEVLPSSMSATTPDVNGMLTCLSCHDGNYASGAMMRNKLYETLPSSYGTGNTVPTLFGSNGAGAGAGSYLNDHPMGLSAKMSCGGSGNWDCTQANGVIKMNGANSSRFVANYGFFVQPGNYSNSAVIVCTTCHEPHSMNVVSVSKGSTSGLPAGNYATMFFLRAPYNPGDPNPLSNQTAQFCRQCHGDKSNEMHGSSAGTVF